MNLVSPSGRSLADLADDRRDLLVSAVALISDPAPLVEVQLTIAVHLAWAERVRSELPRKDPQRHALRFHQVQLRSVGDTIAWLVLDAHSIRSLGKGPGRPASIVGQELGLPLVAETARELATEGNRVVLSDTTNILRQGDLVALSPESGLRLVECKRSESSARSARSRRQSDRSGRVSEYLTTGTSGDPSLGGSVASLGTEGLLLAVDGMPAEHDLGVVQDALQEHARFGKSTIAHTDHQLVIVGQEGGDLPSLPEEAVFPSGSLLAFSTDLINDPSPEHPPVTLWDVDFESMIAIWEKKLLICHVVAVESFLGTHPLDSSIALVEVMTDGQLRGRVGQEEAMLHRRFAGSVLYEWETPESARARALNSCARWRQWTI